MPDLAGEAKMIRRCALDQIMAFTVDSRRASAALHLLRPADPSHIARPLAPLVPALYARIKPANCWSHFKHRKCTDGAVGAGVCPLCVSKLAVLRVQARKTAVETIRHRAHADVCAVLIHRKISSNLGDAI